MDLRMGVHKIFEKKTTWQQGRFTQNNVNFDIHNVSIFGDITYKGHQNCLKIMFHGHLEGFLMTIICDVNIG